MRFRFAAKKCEDKERESRGKTKSHIMLKIKLHREREDLSTSDERAGKGVHCEASLEVIWPLLLASNDAHVVPAFLTLPLCQVLNRLPARRLA